MSSAHESDVLALIPAHNEAARIAAVIAGARPHLPVLVVDDGSADDTAGCARRAGAEVLIQSPNQGKGAALQAGFRRALDRGVEAVLTLDADGQHDPAEIPLFLTARSERAGDLIIGARDFNRMPPVRRLSNSIGRWSFSWAVGRPIRDNQSGYRLLSRRMIEAVLDGGESGFEYEVEMIVRCVELDYRLDWVPIRTIYADERSHIRPLRHAAGFLRLVWRTRRRLSARRSPRSAPPGKGGATRDVQTRNKAP